MKRIAIVMILCLSLVLCACGTAGREEGRAPVKKDPAVSGAVQKKPTDPARAESSPPREEIHREVETDQKPAADRTPDRHQSGGKEPSGTDEPEKKPARPAESLQKPKPAPKPAVRPKPAPRPEVKPVPKPVPKPEPKPAPKPEPKPAPSPKPETHEHHYTAEKIPATCSKEGYTRYTCSCGKSYTAERTPALGHQYGAWKVIREATWEAEGREQRTCSRCGKTESRTIPQKVRPQLDLEQLCAYAIQYAEETYGYRYTPGMRDGYYPAYSCCITTMEEGYAAMQGCVDDQTRALEAIGSDLDQMPFDIEIYPDPYGFADTYCVQLYY